METEFLSQNPFAAKQKRIHEKRKWILLLWIASFVLIVILVATLLLLHTVKGYFTEEIISVENLIDGGTRTNVTTKSAPIFVVLLLACIFIPFIITVLISSNWMKRCNRAYEIYQTEFQNWLEKHGYEWSYLLH